MASANKTCAYFITATKKYIYMTDSERFKILLDYLKEERIVRNQQDFVERIDENPTVVSAYKNGKREFSANFIYKVCKTYPFISEEWLKGESNEMLVVNLEQAEIEQPMCYERLVELGGEAFATKMLDMFRNGQIYSSESYKSLADWNKDIIDNKDIEINRLNQEIGKLKAIIEMMKGKSPEDLLK